MKVTVLILLLAVAACTSSPDAQQIVDRAIETHGGKRYENASVSFTFRGKDYSVTQQDGKKRYTRSFKDDSLGQVKDVLFNSVEFSRFVNGEKIEVSKEWAFRYTESVNSVLYFFQLPYGLNDPAVNKSYLGEVTVKGKPYHKVKITFGKENGGVDYQDHFIYWIHKEDYTVDYLAYSYATEETGTRFRQAINRRNVDGIIVQDYINFKPVEEGKLLEEHDTLFDTGQLKELSRIVNENVKVVYKKE
jgi:hypothetical protein